MRHTHRFVALALALAAPVLVAACGGDDTAPPDGGPRDAGAGDGGSTPVDAHTPPSSEVLHNADGANDRYNGIGRARVPSSCTATLLDVGGGDDAPAYALSAGHCTNWWEHDRAHVARAPDEDATVVFRFFTDTVDAQVEVPVSVVAYSSMRLTDLAILRLDTTIGALRAEGIEGFAIAGAMPAAGAPIVNIGAPLATVEEDEEHLRRGACTLGRIVDLVEYEWLWPDAVIHDCPDIRTGSSGSPLLGEDGEIVAVVNTTASEPAHALCHLGRPCELAEGGPTSFDGRSYAIPVAQLGACFSSAGVLDLDAEGCALEPGPFATTERGVSRYVRPTASSALDLTVLAQDGFTHYRAKAGPAGTTDCRDDAGYGEARAIDTAPRFEAPLPLADGLTIGCVRAGTSPTTIAPASQAVAWIVATDSTPPPLPLPVTYTTADRSATFSVWVENPTYSMFDQKSGPAATTDCADPEGYEFVNVRFGHFTVHTEGDGALRVCIVSTDFADNVSAPQEWVLFE